jgi:hypothetical protein
VRPLAAARHEPPISISIDEHQPVSSSRGGHAPGPTGVDELETASADSSSQRVGDHQKPIIRFTAITMPIRRVYRADIGRRPDRIPASDR